jgi:hypothetical protein
MLVTLLATALAFVATAVATPAVSIRDLTANAAVNALVADSFSGAFPGIMLATSEMAAGCKTSKDCPPCKKCTYCDNWTPGCCKRISVCNSWVEIVLCL